MTAFVGDGPTLQHDNERVIAAFNQFWSSCDAEGVSNFGHLLARVVRSLLVAGEAFIVFKVDRDTGALVLMLVSPEQVDVNRNEDLGGGAFVTSGIEVNADGRHVALWILPRSPDHPIAASTSVDAVRIPVEDVCHVIDPPSPGAPRGVSQLSAILTRAVEVDATEDAQVAQQKVAALLNVFINEPSQQVELGKSLDGNSVSLEPATVRIIPGDANVNVVSPPQIQGGVKFQRAMIRSLAAGAQVPFELVSADLSQTSFSSARFGDRFFRRRTVQVQKTLLEPQFLDRVFRRFVALEVLAGRLDVDLETLAPPRWLWPQFEALNPKEDVEADASAVVNSIAATFARPGTASLGLATTK